MQSTVVSFQELCKGLKNNPAANIELVRKANEFASHIHSGQFTPNGRRRIDHLINTAKIISRVATDDETLAASILHDAIIYGHTQREELEKLFGQEIANLVEEYTKELRIEEANIGRLDFGLLSKIVLASAKDIRSLFIKMVAVIDYSLGGDYLDNELSEKKALTALNVYAPICHKLGLNEWEWLLEDLAFKQLYREDYLAIKELVNEKREHREKKAEEVRAAIAALLKTAGLNGYTQARAKHFYSIYKKMKKKPFSEIYDLLGVRIICETTEECYEALGIINSNYDTIGHKFRDYIADAKENRYKSIHTTIIFEGCPVEVQIRTWQMHWDNEVGFAAHWQYKEHKRDKYFDKKLSIIKQLMEWHKTQRNSQELTQSLKTRAGNERIFVFTPKREVIILAEDSTPIDFAFAIHSEIGFRAKGAKINGKNVALDHALENADTVEILTSNRPQAKRQWLNFVKTDKAKTKIRQILGIKEPKKEKRKPKREKTTSDLSVRMANCCKPLPGDEIIGYRTTKRKISVHRRNCRNVEKLEANRIVVVAWEPQKNYAAELKISARENAALIPQVLRIFSENGIKIDATQAKTTNGVMKCSFSISVNSREQLEKATKKIAGLPYVLGAERA
jgi:GTP pyrophosphokinase